MTSIAVDVRMLHASGIGTYLRHLLPLVIRSMDDVVFHLLGDSEALAALRWQAMPNVRLVDCKAPIYSIREQFELARKIPESTELFWSPHYNIPLFYRGCLLVTVHDVFHLAMPEFVGGFHKRLYAKAMFGAVARSADIVVCDSGFTARELLKFTGVPEQKLRVIRLGIDRSWFAPSRVPSPHEKPFLLFVGNVKPHKNLVRLLDAFSSIAEVVPHDLVIVGKKEGFITGDDVVKERALRLGDRVHFTGYVDDAALRQYFSHAAALVFPSLYEGFGLPPLEAMASGCPVIVSNAASLPEVCGEAAVYCDPYHSEDIAQQILLVLRDESLRADLARKGLEQARKFTWEACAEETSRVMRGLLG
jgi:glycosyltransferase involved in cell wall biosynthesis